MFRCGNRVWINPKTSVAHNMAQTCVKSIATFAARFSTYV